MLEEQKLIQHQTMIQDILIRNMRMDKDIIFMYN